MKKNGIKKLVLAKETVKSLETVNLGEVAGGITMRLTCNNLSACNNTWCC